VPEPENLNSITSSTLAQLLEIDTQLSVQEAHLSAQLESIQHKRQSLQVVIALFDETDKTDVAAPIEETITTTRAQNEKQPESVEEEKVVSQTDKDKLLIPAPIAPASKTDKKTATSSAKKSQTRKSQTSKSKTVKQPPGWQQYLREDFRNSSLPQAISEVLHSQPERVWDISAVVDAIFVSEIPHEVKKKVRLQITNLLAQGARENKWYRGQQGSYTLSGKAAKS
jgi:glucan-binding YG repeat protein